MSYQTRLKLKTLFTQLYRFAIENDIVEKDYSKFVDVGEETTKLERIPFSDAEIEKLWANIDKPYVDSVLIMIYSGMRVGELLMIETKNIDLENRIMIGGIKTKAGIDRAIPIHKRLISLIDTSKEFLVTSPTGKKFSYNNYIQRYFTPLMQELGMSHLPHDCRHTTATKLDNANVNRTIIKRILGHASTDITEKVYTHKSHAQLIEAIDAI